MSEMIDDKSNPITITKLSLSEQEKRNYYEAWKCSGMSKRQFCQEHGLSVGEFYYWHKLFRPKTTIKSEQFSPVSATASLACEPKDIIQIEIRLPHQAQQSLIKLEYQLVLFIQELCNAATIIR